MKSTKLSSLKYCRRIRYKLYICLIDSLLFVLLLLQFSVSWRERVGGWGVRGIGDRQACRQSVALILGIIISRLLIVHNTKWWRVPTGASHIRVLAFRVSKSVSLFTPHSDKTMTAVVYRDGQSGRIQKQIISFLCILRKQTNPSRCSHIVKENGKLNDWLKW